MENHLGNTQETINKKIERVAAYIRVSTQEQKLHGISLEAQIEKLTEYAKAHNMLIVEWYKDEGISGRKLIKKRPDLQRMIQDAEKGEFDRIIFIKLDRFFRSVAEYHECMKRLAVGGVIWTATEEKYDLSTPSGEAFVNMKLTMAQFEADQAGERIRMVNEYKIKSGQPLFGAQSLPLCYTVAHPEDGERHKYIAKHDAELMQDAIAHVMKNHSVRAALSYINNKYNRTMGYNVLKNALTNEMICGAYKGNPNYCEPYITREEFELLQTYIKRSPRTTPAEHAYVFTGLLLCPECGRRLNGAVIYNGQQKKSGKKTYKYRGYRCPKHQISKLCGFKHVVFEKRIELELLANVERILQDKMVNVLHVKDGIERVSKHDVKALQQELDRLNYSWQKGRIKSVEEYDKKYDALIAQIDEANAERAELHNEPDYSLIKLNLVEGWKDIYSKLDAEHKRSFWRSFIDEIQIEWTKDVKRITDIKFL